MPSLTSRSRSKGKSGKSKGASVLAGEQRALLEQQSELQAKIDALQRTIAAAPVRAAEEHRRNREAIIASTQRYHLHSANLLEMRRPETAGAARRGGGRKRVVLREERKAARTQTFALIVALAFAVCWALGHYAII